MRANDQRIPRPRTRLIGREREVQDVLALVDDPEVSLVTLTGPGGIGKTRIALHVASVVHDQGDQDVVFVDLTAVTSCELVLPEIARGMGVRAAGQIGVADQLRAALGARNVLLVLDNFEHVIEAASRIGALLDDGVPSTILITSRVRLHLEHEHEYSLGSLPVPLDVRLHGTDELAAFDAVQLFIERARWAQPEFELTPATTLAVAEICQHLDGLPLAIVLAASRTRALPPTAMRSRLQRRLPFLTGEHRDLPERQRTMHRTITWSYDLLPVEEQRFFRAMATFTDGFSFEAADAVHRAISGEAADTLARLSSLIDKSLLRNTVGRDGEPRYRMLETIREFGLEQVATHGEESSLRDIHANFYIELAGEAATSFRPFIQLAAVDRLQTDVANLRSALSWLHATGRHDDFRKLAVALRRFWFLGGHEREGLDWLSQAIALSPSKADATHTEALLASAELAQRLHDPAAATHLAAMFCAGPADLHQDADGTQLLAIMAEDSGDYDRAEELLIASRVLYEQLGEPWYPIVVDYHLGIQAYGKGNLDSARSLMETALSAARQLGDVLVPRWCLLFLSLIACEQDRPTDAAAMLRRIQEPNPSSGLPSLHLHHHPMYLSALAALATAIEEWSTAARLFGAANADHRATVLAMPEAATFARAQALGREHLPAEDYHAAWEAGTKMHPQDVWDEVDQLLARAETVGPAIDRDATSPLLTPRELEVLRLLATGQSNRQIAEALFVSPGTVKVHVTHILAKLGLGSRAAATDYAHRHHLT